MKSIEILKMLQRAVKIFKKLQNLNPQKNFMAEQQGIQEHNTA